MLKYVIGLEGQIGRKKVFTQSDIEHSFSKNLKVFHSDLTLSKQET